LRPAHSRLGLFQVIEDAPGVLQEAFAGKRERRSPSRPFKQGDAQFPLQIPNLPRQRRLGYVQTDRGPDKASAFGNGNKVAQMTEFHVLRPISKKHVNIPIKNYTTLNSRCNVLLTTETKAS